MNSRNLTFSEAINEAQIQAMKLDSNVFIFGQGVDKTANLTTKDILKFGKKFLTLLILSKRNCTFS